MQILRRLLYLFILLLLIYVFSPLSDSLFIKTPIKKIERLHEKLHGIMKQKGILYYLSFDPFLPQEEIHGHEVWNYNCARVPGKFGLARFFSGQSDCYIDSDIPLNQLSDTFTYSMWLKLGPTPAKSQSIAFANVGTVKIGFFYKDHQLQFYLPSASENNMLKAPFPDTDQFVHIAATVSLPDQQAKLFINGDKVDQCAVTNLAKVNSVLKFGKMHNIKVSYPLSGIIDECSVWNICLLESDIKNLAIATSPLPDTLIRNFTPKLDSLQNLKERASLFLKAVGLFNPFYHYSRLQQSSLRQINLELSKKDLRAFNRSQKDMLDFGAFNYSLSSCRKIRFHEGNTSQEAQAEILFKDEASLQSPIPSFLIHLEEKAVMNARTLELYPCSLETGLRPLIQREMEKTLGLPSTIDICALSINDTFKGLYYIRKAAPPNPSNFWPTHTAIDYILPHIYLDNNFVLNAYDRVANTYTDFFLNDHIYSRSRREFMFHLRNDRKDIRKFMKQRPLSDIDAELESWRQFVRPEWFLDQNLASHYVTQDLSFHRFNIPGIDVRFKSLSPDVIEHSGKIHPPKTTHQTVQIELKLTRQNHSVKNILSYTVVSPRNPFPLIHVRTSHLMQNDTRATCDISFLNWDDRPVNLAMHFKAKIKYRGNTALLYPKKSFSLKTAHPHGLWNTKSRHINFISCYSDRSFVKNKLAYDLFRSFSTSNHQRYAPQVRFAEVILDQTYMGLYEISERVDQHMLDANETSGAYLYKAVGSHANFKDLSHQSYLQKFPKQVNWEPYEQLITSIRTQPPLFNEIIDNVIEIGNIIDFQILLNLTYNTDGQNHNLFLFRKSSMTPFEIIPWDYDKSWGLATDKILSNHLIQQLARHYPEYLENVSARWFELRENILDTDRILSLIDGWHKQLQPAMERDFNVWPSEISLHEEQTLLREWIKSRLLFLDDYYSDESHSMEYKNVS